MATSRFLRPFQAFAQSEARGSIALLACTGVALLWANSPLGASYHHLWERAYAVGPDASPLTLTLHAWINDGLMAVFFLLVGLELKRELLVGELASVRQATLPIAAAIGGMVVPALIFFAINPTGSASAGWGIPMATDIAFALGILRLIGPHLPLGLSVFLTALAIADDLGAVLVIALFYTASVDVAALGWAAATLLGLVILNRRRVVSLLPYMILGVVLWYWMHESGVHATIAGVLLALTIPTTTRINAAEFSERSRRLLDEFDRAETGDLLVLTSKGQQEALQGLDLEVSQVNAPLVRLETALHTPVAFFILPLFALSNAGVALGEIWTSAGTVALGVALGLIAGKPIGILGASWLAVRLGLASLPLGVTWRHLRGASLLAGIGFTMSLFIGTLAFDDTALLTSAKVGILLASIVAAASGWLVLRGSDERMRAP
jgi:Na+:H+ antiporter, NhaA family